MKRTNLLKLFALFVFAAFFFAGCEKHLGYSVLLWNLDDRQLSDGEIVRVYIKSNISKTYIVSKLDGDEKFEIPLWQITSPSSKKKALEKSKSFGDFSNTYARVLLDGLPVRAEAQNVSKQVYRLRENEIIRVLALGQGEKPKTGDKEIEGEWLSVLAKDGTRGWCFSHSLKVFKMKAGEKAWTDESKDALPEVKEDAALKALLESKWYPESFGDMISKKMIDPTLMKSTYGFDSGAKSGTIKLQDSDTDVSFVYSGIEKVAKNRYKFVSAPIEVTVRNEGAISVSYTDESGKPKMYKMITLKENVEELIASEISRRARLFKAIVAAGPDFSSSNYGSLHFTSDGKFTWKKFNQLIPALLDKGTKGNGSVSIKYFVGDKLKKDWDGVLTFSFENMNREVNFLYKLESSGLRLEDTNKTHMNGNIVEERSRNPLVLYFAK